MKKITLLLVAAVFAIGIQSCSTEEEVLLEEKVNTTEQQKSLLIPTERERLRDYTYIFFSDAMTNEKRNELKNLLRTRVYSTLLTVLDKSCSEMETWEIGKYDQALFEQSGFATLPDGTITADARTEEEDEDSIIPDPLAKGLSPIETQHIGGYIIRFYSSQEVPEPCHSDDSTLLN